MNDFIRKNPFLTFLINFLLMLLVAAISVTFTLKYLIARYGIELDKMFVYIREIHNVIVNQ